MNHKQVSLASLVACLVAYTTSLQELVVAVRRVEMYGNIPGKRGPQLISMMVTEADVIEAIRVKFFDPTYGLYQVPWVCDVITNSLAADARQLS